MAFRLSVHLAQRPRLFSSAVTLVGVLVVALVAPPSRSVATAWTAPLALIQSEDEPSVSRLRMRRDMGAAARDHFAQAADAVYVSFDYADVDIYDSIRLLIRDVNGTATLDHTFAGLNGTGTKQVVFTGRDAASGLVQSGLGAGSDVRRFVEAALQRDSRFAMAPFIEQAFFSATVLDGAAQMLGRFDIGPEATAELILAQAHTAAAVDAARATFDPELSVAATRELLKITREETRVGMSQLAEVQAALPDGPIAFPDTVDCRFNLTSVYLNRAPVDSIEWTVGAPGPPARIYPPLDTRHPGRVDVRPDLVYTQDVAAPGAPHTALVRGRAVDADCRPVADETPVLLTLDDPSLGSFVADQVATMQGYFTATLRTSSRLGDGFALVRANASAAEATAPVFLVGPPSRLNVEVGAVSVAPGATTSVAVEVLDALGHRVADGTVVKLSLLPASAGSIEPSTAGTESGQVAATFRAGDRAMQALIRVEAGDVVRSQPVSIVGLTPTPDSSPTVQLTAEPSTGAPRP
jgi:hypothetical protein